MLFPIRRVTAAKSVLFGRSNGLTFRFFTEKRHGSTEINRVESIDEYLKT